MKNPFTTIAEERKGEVIDGWLNAKLIANESNGRDLVELKDEWGIYSVGEVKKLGELAGLRIEFAGIDLQQLLSSTVVTDLFDDVWIRKIKSLDDVYMDLVLDYIKACGLQPEACIKII